MEEEEEDYQRSRQHEKEKSADRVFPQKTPKIPRDKKIGSSFALLPLFLFFPRLGRSVSLLGLTRFFSSCVPIAPEEEEEEKKVDRRKRRAKDLRPKTVRCFGLLLSGEGR